MPDALRLDVEPTFSDPVLLLAFEGWNDAGEAASGAADYVSRALHMAPLGEIDPEEYYDFTVRRPTVRIDEGDVRRIDWPAYRFRYGVLESRFELIVGTGGEPHLRWRSFCDDVLGLVRRFRIRRVMLLGAFLADVLYSLPVRVSGFSQPPERLDDAAIEGTRYEGPTGIVGALSDRLRQEGIELVSLWAGLPHYIPLTPNPRGSLALLHKATQLLDLPLDLSVLEKAAADFETQVSKLIAADPALAEYVKELKRREFAAQEE